MKKLIVMLVMIVAFTGIILAGEGGKSGDRRKAGPVKEIKPPTMKLKK